MIVKLKLKAELFNQIPGFGLTIIHRTDGDTDGAGTDVVTRTQSNTVIMLLQLTVLLLVKQNVASCFGFVTLGCFEMQMLCLDTMFFMWHVNH